MEFSLNNEQQQLKDSLERYLAKSYTFDMRRKLLNADMSAVSPHWRAFSEFGLLGIGIGEEFGGMGVSTNLGGTGVAAEDTMLVMEAFGRSLMLEPYLTSIVVAGSVLQAGAHTSSATDAKARCGDLLGDLVSAARTVALATHERQGRYKLSHVATTAKRAGAHFVLNGSKAVALQGDSANTLIISARSSGAVGDTEGISLFIVDPNTEGLSRRGYATNDGQRAADITLHNVKISADNLICVEGNAYPTIESAIDAGLAALCAEAVGAMDALITQTLDYLKSRKQFGVAIGSFQALQHKMVDMFIATEQARSMAILAALKVASSDAVERRRAIAAAKSLVGQSARLVAQQAVQLHGGMGVTDDLPISHYFKRLTAIDMTWGDAHYHRSRLGTMMLETA
jgi:alkylation response protein AidB-like acyl-CoA dehydrogenase